MRPLNSRWSGFFFLILLSLAPAGAQTLTILTSSLPSGTIGTLYATGLTVSGGTTPYTWSGTGSVPPGLTVNSSGTITGTPTTAGTFPFTLNVTDARGLSASKSLSITVTGPSFSITTSSPLPSGTVGQPYSQTLTATGGTSPLVWAAGPGLPDGLTFSASGAISGTPIKAGPFSFSVQLTDANQNTANGNFSLTINAPSISITTTSLFNGTVGLSYAQTLSVSGGTAPYTWSVISGNTDGLNLGSGSGVLQGTPQNAGTFSFTVQVKDSSGATASQTFSLVINPPALTITTAGQVPTGMVAVTYKLSLVASGGTAPYTWSANFGSLAGLSIDSNSGLISGTPTAAGNFNVAVQVRDTAGLTGTKSLAITITPAGLTITTSRQLPDATFNAPYSQQIAASGGTPPYTWSANFGSLAGLSIDPNSGLISGTPIAAGSFGFAITVRDSALNSYSDRFTVNVNLPAVPALTISGLPATVDPAQQFPLQITLASPFLAAIAGQAILTFSPDTGPGDKTVLFASGGTSASFTIPAGSTAAVSDVPLALQTGTVSGTITVSLRLQAGVTDITPTPAPSVSTQLTRAAPTIQQVQASRSTNAISVAITGFSTAREVTQATFKFNAAAGQALQSTASSITVSVDNLFGTWFQDSSNAQYGSQFVFTQPFTVQGDSNAVIPVSVTLTNRIGSTTFTVNP